MISVVVPVFRDVGNALALIDALLHQELSDGCPLEIIVVDDGSEDDSIDVLRQHESDRVHIIALPHNQGRAIARNIGAAQARGEYLAFIDCDCRPVDRHFLELHRRALYGEIIASCGPVTGDGCGFWSRYQQDTSLRRARQHARGMAYAGSSQNFMVRTRAFLDVGGFDTRYKEYGFEDRDLFVRLSRAGKIGWCAHAGVRHLDRLALVHIVTKMQIAAGESAILFSDDHPEVYQQLGYAALDVRLHGWLRPACLVFRPLLRTTSVIDRVLELGWLPYPVARVVVKLYVALAYASGSVMK